MSDEKNKVTDKASEIAKNIWLAGVGAYGKAVEDAQDRIEKAMEPPKLFKDLVKAGSALEEDAREALESTAQARASVEERISRVRENFHMQRPARIEDIAALERKVEALAKQVTVLTKALSEQGLAVKPKRAAAQRKKAADANASTRKRTAGKKSGTKSTTAKKASGKKPTTPRKKAALKNKTSTKSAAAKPAKSRKVAGKAASGTATATSRRQKAPSKRRS